MKSMKTERLYLRGYTLEDLPDLHNILSDPRTMSFWPAPFTLEDSERWIRRNMESYDKGFGRMAVILQESGALVGDVGLQMYEMDGALENDLGYIIHSAYWNRGFGFEAAEAVMAYGLQDLQMKRICANMPVEHTSSRKVAEKLGMVLEKRFMNVRNRNLPTFLYAKNV